MISFLKLYIWQYSRMVISHPLTRGIISSTTCLHWRQVDGQPHCRLNHLAGMGLLGIADGAKSRLSILCLIAIELLFVKCRRKWPIWPVARLLSI